MKTPEVSIVMPVYNAAATLDAAVCSILDQTWQEFKFIMVDDGTLDDTPCKLARDLWLQASAVTEFSNIPEILFKDRA